MKPDDHEDISDSKTLHFVQGAGLLNEWAKRLHTRSITVEVPGVTQCLPFCNLVFSILFHSNSGDKMMNFTSKRHLGWLTKTREERWCEPSSAAILTTHWDFLPLPQNTSGQGWTNPRYVVALTTKLHIVTSRIFSINYCNFPLLHTKICIKSHAPNRKHHITVMFTCHSRPVGAWYSIGHVSPLRHLQFGDDF
jgi:hypothetical protein